MSALNSLTAELLQHEETNYKNVQVNKEFIEDNCLLNIFQVNAKVRAGN